MNKSFLRNINSIRLDFNNKTSCILNCIDDFDLELSQSSSDSLRITIAEFDPLIKDNYEKKRLITNITIIYTIDSYRNSNKKDVRTDFYTVNAQIEELSFCKNIGSRSYIELGITGDFYV